MNVGQLKLSSGNSAPNSGNNHHMKIPYSSSSRKIPGTEGTNQTAIKTITADVLQTVWNELDYRVDTCRITKGAHIEHL